MTKTFRMFYLLLLASLLLGCHTYLVKNRGSPIEEEQIVTRRVAKVKPKQEEVIAACILKMRPQLQKEVVRKYSTIIYKECRESNYDWKLIVAIMKTESDFRESVVSHKGAIGLMQLMPDTANWLIEKLELPQSKIVSPSTNIKLGISYLQMLEERLGREKAIVAYNRGPTRTCKEYAADTPREEYLKKVLSYYQTINDM